MTGLDPNFQTPGMFKLQVHNSNGKLPVKPAKEFVKIHNIATVEVEKQSITIIRS